MGRPDSSAGRDRQPNDDMSEGEEDLRVKKEVKKEPEPVPAQEVLELRGRRVKRVAKREVAEVSSVVGDEQKSVKMEEEPVPSPEVVELKKNKKAAKRAVMIDLSDDDGEQPPVKREVKEEEEAEAEPVPSQEVLELRLRVAELEKEKQIFELQQKVAKLENDNATLEEEKEKLAESREWCRVTIKRLGDGRMSDRARIVELERQLELLARKLAMHEQLRPDLPQSSFSAHHYGRPQHVQQQQQQMMHGDGGGADEWMN